MKTANKIVYVVMALEQPLLYQLLLKMNLPTTCGPTEYGMVKPMLEGSRLVSKNTDAGQTLLAQTLRACGVELPSYEESAAPIDYSKVDAVLIFDDKRLLYFEPASLELILKRGW